jgi:hypothetical protein
MTEYIIDTLSSLLDTCKHLSSEVKFDKRGERRLICYYYIKNGSKKLLFYINPSKKGVVFAVDHYGNGILERYPTLIALADEKRTSVIKFSIKTPDDIQSKAIAQVIALCIEAVGLGEK